MDIAFRARNIDIPETLRGTVADEVTRLARRFGFERAEVSFSGERNPRNPDRQRCTITLWGPQHILRAEAAAAEAGVAANRVLGVLERRASRLLGRLTVHFLPNRSTVGLRSSPDQDDPAQQSAGRVAGMGDRDADSGPVTPEDAALEMLAWDQDRWWFVNVETGRPAVLLRRRDGRIELAEDVLRAVS